MASQKLATCCYCGARAALVLHGDTRHELACSNCGAPLHNLKALKSEPKRAVKQAVRPTKNAHPHPPAANLGLGGLFEEAHRVAKSKKKKKKKSGSAYFFKKAFDVIEDIFD